MNNNLPQIQQQTQKALTIRDYLFSDNIKNQLAVAVPKWLSVDRLLRITFTSIMKNPQLLDCTRESLLGAVMQCAQLGLEPVMNRAHLVPYWNGKKKTLECQFQPGYAGLADLGRRSGKISNITSHVVYENDEFDLEYGTDEHLYHKPALKGDRGKPIGVYAVWFYKDGTKSAQFIPLQECYEKHRARSQSYKSAIEKNHDNSPWITDESIMLKKTAVKVSSKLQDLSIEFMQAVELDNQAEMGQTQQGFFLEPPRSNESPETILKDFDATIPKNIDQNQLNDFLELCANQFNRSINDIKIEAAETPEEFWKAFYDWQKKQTKAKDETQPEKESDHLIDQFSKLNKEPLEEYEKAHRDEIKTWPQEARDAFAEKWEKKIHQSYEAFLRRLDLINGKGFSQESKQSENMTEETQQPMDTVVCPTDREHKPLAFCKNARGKDKPCERFIAQDCLARWPE